MAVSNSNPNKMKTARVLATEIEYDTDGVSVAHLKNEGAYLPSEIWLEVETEEPQSLAHSTEIADAISDVTGFCVLSFQFKAFAS